MRKHTFGEWMIAVRPWSIPASAMPIIATLAFLFYKNSEINWLNGIWALIGMILFHLAGNTWSDYFDYRKKVDAEDTFGAKTLTTGMFQPKEIRNLAIGLLCAAVACGLGLLAVTGLPLLWIGLAGLACTLLYPILKFNALGDLDILLTFAFLPTRDMITDKRAGINTMAMSLGNKISAWIYGFEVIFPFVWIGACSIIGIMPLSTIIVFLTLPVAIGCAQTMKNSIDGGAKMIADLDVRTANLQLFFSVLLTIAFAVGKFI